MDVTTQLNTARPPLHAETQQPAWMIPKTYNTPQGGPLPGVDADKRESPFVLLGQLFGAVGSVVGFVWDVVFGKRVR